MTLTREVHKKTGHVIYNSIRRGGRQRYDPVSYHAKDEDGCEVVLSASEYRSYIVAYRVGDVVVHHPSFVQEITAIQQKTKNYLILTITMTYSKDVGVNRRGDTKSWDEECDGRIA